MKFKTIAHFGQVLPEVDRLARFGGAHEEVGVAVVVEINEAAEAVPEPTEPGVDITPTDQLAGGLVDPVRPAPEDEHAAAVDLVVGGADREVVVAILIKIAELGEAESKATANHVPIQDCPLSEFVLFKNLRR